MVKYSLRAKLAKFIQLQLFFVCLTFVPLAIFNLYAGKHFAAVLDLAAIMVAVIFFLLEKNIGSIRLVTLIIVYSYVVIAAVSVTEDKAAALYWFFPIALFCLFLLQPRVALVNICMVFFFLPVIFVMQFGFSHELVVFFASGLVMIGFSYAFVLSGVEIEKIAVTDQLTGVFNRRVLKDFGDLLTTWQTSKYDAFQFMVVVFDINNFKKINDQFGHQVGDKCLIKFADLLTSLTESHKDLNVARIGGDEFLLFGPIEQESRILEEQIEKISNFYVKTDNSNKLSVTASFGIATVGLRIVRRNQDLTNLIKQADTKMYSRKH